MFSERGQLSRAIAQLHMERMSERLISVKFSPATLGPEMAAPIVWAPGMFCFFLQENIHAHEIPHFIRGGGILGLLGEEGGEVPILFYGREDFSENVPRMNTNQTIRATAQGTQGLWGLTSTVWREIWPPTNPSDSNRSNNSEEKMSTSTPPPTPELLS